MTTTLCTFSDVINGTPAVSSGAASAGNLLSWEPKEVWLSDGQDGSILFDFGSAQLFDTVFLGHTNARPGAVWSVGAGNTSAANEVALVSAAPLVEPVTFPLLARRPRVHFYVRLAEPVYKRFVSIAVAQAGAGLPRLEVGTLMVTRSWAPALPKEWGSGRPIIDTGSREPLISGGFGLDPGAVKSGYRWTFGDLTDAEVNTLQAFALACGETRRPMLVVENAEAFTQQGGHYGLFDRFDVYERREERVTRWALAMTEWA